MFYNRFKQFEENVPFLILIIIVNKILSQKFITSSFNEQHKEYSA